MGGIKLYILRYNWSYRARKKGEKNLPKPKLNRVIDREKKEE